MTNLLIGMSSAVCGAGLTWLLMRQRLARVSRELNRERRKAAANRRPDVQSLVQQVLDTTKQIDSDVDRHSNRLAEVNAEIRHVLGNLSSPILNVTQEMLSATAQLQKELQLAKQQIALKQQELEVHASEARTDSLTGLRNRRSFDEELNRLFAQRQRQGTVLSLLMIDIDDFKRINDEFGHLGGDDVLQSFSQALNTTLREMDIVCRYGGEEFAVICPGSHLRDAAFAADRIRHVIETTAVHVEGRRHRITASIGVAEAVPGEIAETLVQRADKALLSAKQAGRNCVHLHDGEVCVPMIEIENLFKAREA